MNLKGILPPVPTPFIGDQIAPKKLSENLKKWNQSDLAGYLVLGSNGEAVMLNDNEKRELMVEARQGIPKNKIMMVGAGSESTIETIRFIHTAAECGSDCALVITPSFYRSSLTQEVLYEHYWHIAEASKIGILLYNVPQYTGITLQAPTVAKLAEHPNIIGMKDSSGDMALFADLIALTPKDFSVFVGNALTLLPALCLGASGGILAVANIVPQVCLRLLRLFDTGQIEEARKIQFKLNPLARAVTAQYGVAGLKAALDLIDYYGGDPRRPLIPVEERTKKEIQGLIQAALL